MGQVRFMGQGKQSHSHLLSILLIALAIQGITPDAKDIVSPRAFYVLCPSVAKDQAFQDEDDSPDDACELVHSNSNRLARTQPEKLRSSDLPPVEAYWTLLQVHTRQHIRHGWLDESPLRLIHSLCRLRC
jgi:hypothetical protein